MYILYITEKFRTEKNVFHSMARWLWTHSNVFTEVVIVSEASQIKIRINYSRMYCLSMANTELNEARGTVYSCKSHIESPIKPLGTCFFFSNMS